MNKAMAFSKRKKVAALMAVLALAGTACGSNDDDKSSASSDNSMMTPTTAAKSMSLTPFGSACSQVPTSGEGSVAGMADDPVGTAASNNPLLTTLVTAVKTAGLVDTLNGAGPFTVFAPVNTAFAKVPSADLSALLADKAKLTDVLTYHVVPQRVVAADLKDGGTLTSVEGKKLTIKKSGNDIQVNGVNVICANVPVGNGVVYLVDTVLMPPAA